MSTKIYHAWKVELANLREFQLALADAAFHVTAHAFKNAYDELGRFGIDVWVAWDSNAELVAIPLCLWAHFFAEYKETSKGPANGLYGVPWVVSDLVKRPLLEV